MNAGSGRFDLIPNFFSAPATTDELRDDELESVAGGFLDAGRDVNVCLGGQLINTKMEINVG